MRPLPPYADAMGIARAQPDDDPAALLRMPAAEQLFGRPGFLHGGAIAGLLEIVAHVALRDALGDTPVRIKPITVTIDYMRGGRATLTYAAADIVRLGSRIANVDAVAWQADRAAPIAAARLTLLLDPPRS